MSKETISRITDKVISEMQEWSNRPLDARLSDGRAHEHLVHLWWVNPMTDKEGDNTRTQIVSWIEDEKGEAYVEDTSGNRANVGVVTPSHEQKYLRTYADRQWTDNLLALPRR